MKNCHYIFTENAAVEQCPKGISARRASVSNSWFFPQRSGGGNEKHNPPGSNVAGLKNKQRLCPVGVDVIVYARHGRELMGCKSPVREPKGVHDYGY